MRARGPSGDGIESVEPGVEPGVPTVPLQWIDAAWTLAWRLPVDPATISVLGWDRGTAVLERWNS